MKMALPPRKDVQYIRRKLKTWYEANKSNKHEPNEQRIEFVRAVMRLCDFFQVLIPKIGFYKELPGALGQCTAGGEIQVLTPHHYNGDYRSWAKTFFHEFGHYIYYANAERKANEFEKRMMDRW